MAFDYKKEYKEFYMPKNKPSIISVPKMNYIAVRGSGDPNAEDGEYKKAIGILYAIAFTIKMSKKGNHKIGEGYFDYVVPPLEGFWWQGERHPVDATLRTDRAGRQERMDGIDYADKLTMHTRKIFSGSRLSVCRTLWRKMISNGLWLRRQKRKNRISQRPRF